MFKNRDITLPTKVHLVKAMVFPVVVYGCESWTVKKAECWRIDAFELWCWRRLLRVPWTARRSTQSILKEISPWISLEGMMLKLKLQDFGHLIRRADSLEKTLMLGGIGGRRRRGGRGWDGWMTSLTWWTWVWVNSGNWWWTGRPGVLRFMGSQRVGHNWVTELNWTVRNISDNPFKVWKLCTNVFSLIVDIDNLFHLSFLVWLEVYQLYQAFLKVKFWTLFFSIAFLIYTFTFLLLLQI